jgi:hypothetical protein
MSEENQPSPAPPGNGGADPSAILDPPSSPPVSELTVLNGGIEIYAVKIDGGQEKVKVRQLPISLVGEWGRSQGDEAHLVELLCDKLDRTTSFHLQNARLIEMRLQMILQQAPFEQTEAIEKRLIAIREEIAKHEAKPRWSDTLTHETVAKIRELGELLNKKKFVEQTNRTTTASKALLEMMTPEKSPSPSSSSASPISAESPSAT